MEIEIGKPEVEALLMLLYKLDEYTACEALLEVYRKYFADEDGNEEDGYLH